MNQANPAIFCCIAALGVQGCASHDGPLLSDTEGEVSLDLVGGDPPIEHFEIRSPEGDVYYRLNDKGDACELFVNASNPVLGNITRDARSRRVHFIIRKKLKEDSPLFRGEAATLSAHPGFLLANEATITLSRRFGPESGEEDFYSSQSGEFEALPLPRPGEWGEVRFQDVSVKNARVRADARRLSGGLRARFEGIVRKDENARACPLDASYDRP